MRSLFKKKTHTHETALIWSRRKFIEINIPCACARPLAIILKLNQFEASAWELQSIHRYSGSFVLSFCLSKHIHTAHLKVFARQLRALVHEIQSCIWFQYV